MNQPTFRFARTFALFWAVAMSLMLTLSAPVSAAEEEAQTRHFERLRSREPETIETSSLHLDALRDLKQVNAHLVEAAAYPLLRASGALLSTRIKAAE